MQKYDDIAGLTNVVNHIAHDENSKQECQLQEELSLSEGWVIEGLTTLNDAYHVQFNHGNQQSHNLKTETMKALAPQLPPFPLSNVILSVCFSIGASTTLINYIYC